MANGFFPIKGVAAGLASNTYKAVNAAVSGCTSLYYPPGQCKRPVESSAVNGLMASLLCIIDKAGLGYDCTDMTQTWQAIKKMITDAVTPKIIAATFQTCAGKPHQPNDTIPTCAEMNTAIDDAIKAAVPLDGKGIGSYTQTVSPQHYGSGSFPSSPSLPGIWQARGSPGAFLVSLDGNGGGYYQTITLWQRIS